MKYNYILAHTNLFLSSSSKWSVVISDAAAAAAATHQSVDLWRLDQISTQKLLPQACRRHRRRRRHHRSVSLSSLCDAWRVPKKNINGREKFFKVWACHWHTWHVIDDRTPSQFISEKKTFLSLPLSLLWLHCYYCCLLLVSRVIYFRLLRTCFSVSGPDIHPAIIHSNVAYSALLSHSGRENCHRFEIYARDEQEDVGDEDGPITGDNEWIQWTHRIVSTCICHQVHTWAWHPFAADAD